MRVEQDYVSLPKNLEDINPSCPLSLAHDTPPLHVIQLQDATLGVEGAFIRPQDNMQNLCIELPASLQSCEKKIPCFLNELPCL